MHVVLDDVQVLEGDGQKLGQHVVVVAAQVDDLGAALLHFFQDDADEAGVGVGPVAGLL